MLKIIANKQKVPIGNIWYHKQKASTNSLKYSISLQLNDIRIKDFLNKYLSGEMSNQDIPNQIKAKEQEAGSLGIIWHLIQYFEKDNNEDKNKPYYILSSLDSIDVKEGFLVLEGHINNGVHI